MAWSLRAIDATAWSLPRHRRGVCATAWSCLRQTRRLSPQVSSNAHAEVMREAKAGMMEYQLEARFLYHCASQAVWRNQPVSKVMNLHAIEQTQLRGRRRVDGVGRP